MLRWALLRLLWACVSLLGVTFVTFLVLDLAPVDRAALVVAQRTEEVESSAGSDRDVALARLRIRYGLVDGATLEPVPVLERYGTWLSNAARLQFCGPGEDPAEFRARIARAVPVSLLLGSLALCLALAIGIPLGAWLGMQTSSLVDRLASAVMFASSGLPDVLVATLLVLWFAGPVFDWFPASGLASDDVANGWLAAFWDRVQHLVLPVAVMAISPLVLIVRFLRESVARTAAMPFAHNLVAWGFEPAERRRRILRAALSPLATLTGSLLPMLVAGSIVVETVFSIEGIGRLAFEAVQTQDHAMVMAVTLWTSVATLLAFVVSDLLHRAVDPRVRLDT